MSAQQQQEKTNRQNMHPDITDVLNPFSEAMQLKTDASRISLEERYRLTVQHLKLGKRIHETIKTQGRTVTWLAARLGIERCSLYYIFNKNVIAIDLLIHISILLDHNFVQDILDVYNTYNP